MSLHKGKILIIACLVGIGIGEILLTVRRDLLYAQNREPIIQNQEPGILVTPIDSIPTTDKDCSESNAKAEMPPPPEVNANAASNTTTTALNSVPVKTLLNPVEAAEAAARNSQLRSDLSWTFGQKTQRGWYLYEPLIGHLINTEAPAESADFAQALARWEESAKLIPNGILDQDVLLEIIKVWQSERLKGVPDAAPNELTIAPPADFWSQARPEELRRVERETYAAYKRMVAAALLDKSLNLAKKPDGSIADSEQFLKIVSAYRSPEYQAKLRREAPNSGRAGLATRSPHFTGRALDIYVGGDPVETIDVNRAVQVKTPVYKWLVKNARKFGFRPYFYEPWHWEYVSALPAGGGESVR